MTLDAVRQFCVPRSVVESTEQSLQEAGERGFELFVLWSGLIEDFSFHARHAHVPKQTSYQTDEGLLVRVEGAALHELNVWLFEHEEVLGVQVHAHPTDAFHSETDNTYPIVTALGGLSIVAAHFAQDGLVNKRMAAYRLTRSGWRPIRKAWKSPLLRVID